MEIPEETFLRLHLQSPHNESSYISRAHHTLGQECFADTGISEINSFDISTLIEDGIASDLFVPGQKVVDLGGSIGLTSLDWASYGFDVTSIEISKKAHNYAVDFFKELKNKGIIEDENITFINGNYFTQEYIKKRQSKNSVASNLEKEYENQEIFANKVLFTKNPVEDIYKKNNFSLRDFDVFYAYLWAVQVPSMMELFKYHSKPGAVFATRAAIPNFKFYEFAQDIGLEIITHDISNETIKMTEISNHYLIKPEDKPNVYNK